MNKSNGLEKCTQNEIQCQFCDTYNNTDRETCFICDGSLSFYFKKIPAENVNSKHDINDKIIAKRSDVRDTISIICEYCSHPNKIGDDSCSVCNANLQELNANRLRPVTSNASTVINNVWICPLCTFVNKKESTCCEVCLTSTTVEISSEDVDNRSMTSITSSNCGIWKCKKCGRENSGATYRCTDCQRFASFFRHWDCQRCSYFNADWLQRCEVCNEIREGLVTIESIDNGKMQQIRDLKGDDWESVDDVNCINCRAVLSEHNDYVCYRCSAEQWFCTNRFCCSIIYKNVNYCPKCKLKKGSRVSNCQTVNVFVDNEFVNAKQCPNCGTFCFGDSCTKCNRKLDVNLVGKLLGYKSEIGKRLMNLFK